MCFCSWSLDFFFHVDKIMSYAVILYLSGENFSCFPGHCCPCNQCMFVYCLWLVFHNWVYWTRGNMASRVTYIPASVRFRCAECRAGTSIVGCFAGLDGGPVRVPCPFGFVLACVCVIEQVGGWRGSTTFYSACFGGLVQLKLWVGAVFRFPLFPVCC